MSIRCINAVFQGSHNRGPALLVLLALADFADDNGFCYPGLKALAAKCRMKTPRSVIDALAPLRESGEVSVDKNAGRYCQNEYRIAVARLEAQAAERARAAVKDSALVKKSSLVKESALVKKSAESGEETFMQPVQESSPKPSMNHQEQPSVDGTSAAKMSTDTGPTPSASAPAPADLDAWFDEDEDRPDYDGTNFIEWGAVVALADSFVVPVSWRREAVEEFSLDAETVAVLAETFKAYWTSGDGKGTRLTVNTWNSRFLVLAHELAREGVRA